MNREDRIDNYDQVFRLELQEAVLRYRKAADTFQYRADLVNAGKSSVSVAELENINKILTDFERAFINPRGRFTIRH